METYKLKITLKSDALIGSGEGYGAIIDNDIVFDDLGIPFIPAKRVKGCIRHSAEEINVMFNTQKIDTKIIFGKDGQAQSKPLYFSNLYLEYFEENLPWLKYYRQEYGQLITTEATLATFTRIRNQTAINQDSGVANKHSLRSVRVLNAKENFTDKELVFNGEVLIENDNTAELLALACLNFRHIGTKRNRGFGEVECKLYKVDGTEVLKNSRLEEICKD